MKLSYKNHEKHRVALVSGGSSGIGWATAKRLAGEGFSVVVADIEPPPQDEQNIVFHHCDVRKGNEVDNLFDWMNKNSGLPHILILSAGQGIHERLDEGDPEKWAAIIDINLTGVLRCIRAFIPSVIANCGHVVFLSSVSATKPNPYGGVYSATKAAVEAVAETLRLENLGKLSVCVIAPGVTDTNFFENQVSGNSSVESIGYGSLDAEDVAEDILYAVNKKHGAINKITVRPVGQDF